MGMKDMQIDQGRIRVLGRLLLAAALGVAAATAQAVPVGHDGEQLRFGGEFGEHATLPVPAALVFGAACIAGALALARRRNGRRKPGSP